MSRLLALLLLLSVSSCAAHAKPVLVVQEWTVPLSMGNADRICVETTEPAYRPCLTIAELRVWMVQPRAD